MVLQAFKELLFRKKDFSHQEIVGFPYPELVGERPYKVSEYALQKLQSWGISISETEQMLRAGRSYSYAHPLERLKNVLAGGIFIIGNNDDKISIPHYIDPNPRNPYGECGELAKRLLTIGTELEIWNNKKLKAQLVGGYSPTHFNRGQSTHHWIGLTPSSENFDPHGMVVFDPSFRNVTTLRSAYYNIDCHDRLLISDLSDATTDSTQRTIKSQYIVVNGSRITLSHHNSTEMVLGITPDYQFVVNMLFGKDAKTNTWKSVITLHSSDSGQAFTITRDTHSSQMLIDDKVGNNPDILGLSYLKDIDTMLTLGDNVIQTSANHSARI